MPFRNDSPEDTLNYHCVQKLLKELVELHYEENLIDSIFTVLHSFGNITINNEGDSAPQFVCFLQKYKQHKLY